MQPQRFVRIGKRLDAFPQQLALDVEQRHAPALGEKPFRDRKPDTARGAGYQRDFLQGRVHGWVHSRLIN